MTKREATLVGTTFLLTSAVFVIGYFLIGRDKDGGGDDPDPETPAPVYRGVGGERISWDTAVALRDAYLKGNVLKVRHKGQSGKEAEKKDPLRGFIFSASHLNEIINNNASGEKNVDSVAFFFGKSGEFNDVKEANGSKKPKRFDDFQIIAVGVKNNRLLNRVSGSDTTQGLNVEAARVLRTASVFDKADPCPPFCPSEQ